MDTRTRTTWRIVAVLLALFSAGYVGVLALTQGTTALADTAVRCPMEEQACANGDCANHAACQNGSCSKDCPGNCVKSNGVTE